MTQHTLITFLGRGRDNPQTGYRPATYRFPNGREDSTPFFGLALSRHLLPDKIVLLGTAGSMWDVLAENLADANDADEELRLKLMDAVAAHSVEQSLLDAVTPLLSRATGTRIVPRLISFGRDTAGQSAILEAVAEACQDSDELSLDLTHGFRHLGMLGFLSAFVIERLRPRVRVNGLWYGALDMTECGITPVLRLDGLQAIQGWIDALGRFDASGDYSLFAPLLEIDGVPADKANCLREAAFHESTLNIKDAGSRLRTFLMDLPTELPGASGLFRKRLAEKLDWCRLNRITDQQRELALRALDRRDYLRAAIFGYEAFLSRLCEDAGSDPLDYSTRRETEDVFAKETKDGKHPDSKRQAFWALKNLRNSLAHGLPPEKGKVFLKNKWVELSQVVRKKDNIELLLRDHLKHLTRT